MKNSTLRLFWLTSLFMMAFTVIAIFSENTILVYSMLAMAMVLLPTMVYRVLRDGFEAQRRLINLENREV